MAYRSLKEARPSFSRKRSKKLLRALSRTVETMRFNNAHPTETKVFWSFFSKKDCLPSRVSSKARFYTWEHA